jgi:hypothetical protein
MMQILLPPLMLYAACGLVLSLVVHILSFFGLQFGGYALFVGLHVGIFPLWIPVVFITQKMMGGRRMPRKDVWKAALSGCPAWMRYMTYGFFIYAFVNFAIFMFLTSMHPPVKGGATPPPVMLHGFSGHWMAFYSAGLAILTTAYRRGLSNLQRKCPFGHEAGWSDRFCPTCGSSIAPAQDQN